jgi:cell division protein FtsI/penicillin-binding protein 2
MPHMGKKPIPLSKDHLDVVVEGLQNVVRSSSGTAHPLASLGLDIAGKTGTAQTQKDSHAWFVGFLPYESPRYSFCVFLEHGGSSLEALAVTKILFERMKEENLL